MKRGTIKAFREHLNRTCAGTELHQHGRFRQKTRGYGDYLYHQDREKFDVELAEWLTAYQVNFIDVGRDKRSWSMNFSTMPHEADIELAVRGSRALASREFEAVFDCAAAGFLVAGFRPVGRFRITEAQRSTPGP